MRRRKGGLRLHGTLLPGGLGLPQVVDVWTSRPRALAVAAGLGSSAFVPKRESGRKNENLAPRSAIGSSGSNVRNVATVAVMRCGRLSDSGRRCTGLYTSGYIGILQRHPVNNERPSSHRFDFCAVLSIFFLSINTPVPRPSKTTASKSQGFLYQDDLADKTE